MKTRISLIALVILAVGAVIFSAAPVQAAPQHGKVTFTGGVVNIDYRKSELTLKVGERDSYRVRADKAEVLENGRGIGFRGLQEGDRIRVYGNAHGKGFVDAYTITLINRSLRHDSRWRSGTIITISGTVRSIDTKKGRIDVDSNRGRFQVLAGKNTDIREMGRRISVKDIRSRDRIVVTGRVESSSTLTAHTINIGGSDGGFGRSIGTVLIGEVTRDASFWSRDLRVSTPIGERKVDVPAGARVTRDGRTISVHDINRGDTIRAVGRWSGDTFIAESIDASRTREYEDRYFGKIERMDYDDREFQIRTRGGTYKVVARDAKVINDRREIPFKHLKNGHEVWIFGDRRGSTIYAKGIAFDSDDYRRIRDYRPVSYTR